MNEIIDTHAHLDFDAFDKDRKDVLARANQAGVTRIINIGGAGGMRSNEIALELAQTHDNIWATIGIHPHDAKTVDDEMLVQLAKLAMQERVVAIGETGMDLAKEYSPREVQKKRFRDQLALAKSLDLPIVIHDRDAHSQIKWILQSDGVCGAGGIMHCFSGDADLAKVFIQMGFYISIPGVVTYKNAKKLQQVAREIPLEKMLIETDCPFLAPVPYRGKRNEPSYVKHTAQTIADIRGIPYEELAEHTTRNAISLFRLPV